MNKGLSLTKVIEESLIRQATPQIEDTHPTSLPDHHSSPDSNSVGQPLQIRGKWFFENDRKFIIRGVTYGTFKPDSQGDLFPSPEVVKQDFNKMATAGINTVRVYTAPPLWLLDIAATFKLKVLVGLSWEQHITFLDDQNRSRQITENIMQQVRSCQQHDAILGYTIGNEIPGSIVRWHGPSEIENFLYRLYKAAKELHPQALVTYVNFPPTEYLDLSFVDFICFNVYLESPEDFSSYIARLENIAGDKPLLMAEVGMDSVQHGESKQAATLNWQLAICEQRGLAGVVIFSWTDEWYRGGNTITDWKFGIVDCERNTKPAFDTVSTAFKSGLSAQPGPWPKISVAICTYNGAKTLRQGLDSVFKLNYPDYEVIVVCDGSTDDSEYIAGSFPCQLIVTENHGLSCARNTAWQAADGDIIAYIDDDAFPDADWLTHIARSFRDDKVAAVGGPNIPPGNSGDLAFCVSHSPGSPCHVLLDDKTAEHIPGCNMAILRSILEQTGGFDPQFRAAGDDVDICWRILERNYTIRFNPAAVVWHHRRNTVAGYWRQQKGYGRAEALLEKKHPRKFNGSGHIMWGGRIYEPADQIKGLFFRSRIYYGVWGGNLFQQKHTANHPWQIAWTQLPEWYLLMMIFFLIGLLGVFNTALLWFFALAILQMTASVVGCAAIAAGRRFYLPHESSRAHKAWLITTIAWLHLTQPLMRLSGRLEQGLTLIRSRNATSFKWPGNITIVLWSENYMNSDMCLHRLEKSLLSTAFQVDRGGATDRWDLKVFEGCNTATKILLAIEEHGCNRQMYKFRLMPEYRMVNLIAPGLCLCLCAASAVTAHWTTAGIFCALAVASIWYFCRTNTDSIMDHIRRSFV